MAYNSDGYIMIDFTEVDFRRTNQTIDGLYKRCVDVIGTNKFILVINANGRTPLPATCSFTNNQYVIDTCIYMFAISSNDNLFIRRNDVPASDIIDDDSVSVDKTWSSNKIYTELDGKQNVLTAVSPISIENDNISVDLSSKQNVLTSGDFINISNDVISWTGFKSFTYTGTGTYVNHRIDMPNDLHAILMIEGFTPDEATYKYGRSISIILRMPSGHVNECIFGLYNLSSQVSQVPIKIEYFDGYIQTTSRHNALYNLNQLDVVYTVYYN